MYNFVYDYCYHGAQQTWEIRRFNMIARWYVGKREETNHYGI